MTLDTTKFVGMNLSEAVTLASSLGFDVHIQKNDLPQTLTSDYRANRLYLKVADGVVLGCAIG